MHINAVNTQIVFSVLQNYFVKLLLIFFEFLAWFQIGEWVYLISYGLWVFATRPITSLIIGDIIQHIHLLSHKEMGSLVKYLFLYLFLQGTLGPKSTTFFYLKILDKSVSILPFFKKVPFLKL